MCKQGNGNVYIPLVIFAVLLSLIVVLVGIMISYRREHHRKTAQLLVDAEGPPGLCYQEDAVRSDYSDDPNARPTTIIRNDVYRDSVIDTRDRNNLIVAYTDQNESNSSIYNPRGSKRAVKTKSEEGVILRVQDINYYPNDSERY